MTNPAIILGLLQLAGAGGRVSAPFTQGPQRMADMIPGVGWNEDAAMPADYTAEARGEESADEFLADYDPDTMIGRTNLGRMTMPKDTQHFLDLERGPEQYKIFQQRFSRLANRQYRGEPPPTDQPASVIADRPSGSPGQELNPDHLWAIMRLAQASRAGLVDEVPTPEGRDLAKEWRSTSKKLSQEKGPEKLTELLEKAKKTKEVKELVKWLKSSTSRSRPGETIPTLGW